ncbi:MAG: transporter, partial [Sulfurospirillaceae bacterium]|nr:transporter [Sulfurospirillaceae bacterium]
YCMVVLQLIVFGMFLCNMKLGELNLKLLWYVNLLKFAIMPFITGYILFFILPLEPFVAAVLFLELIVPLAVTNVNIAALYDCKPVDVASLILFTSLLFIPFLLILSYVLSYFSIAQMG